MNGINQAATARKWGVGETPKPRRFPDARTGIYRRPDALPWIEGTPADVLQNALLAPNCHAASGTPSSYFHKSLLKHLVTASVTAQNRAPRRILCSILQHFRKFPLALSYSLTPLLSINCPIIGKLAQILHIYWELPTPRESLGKDANELTNAKILIDDDRYEPWLPFGGRDPTHVEPQSWGRIEARGAQ